MDSETRSFDGEQRGTEPETLLYRVRQSLATLRMIRSEIDEMERRFDRAA
jgi:hypothetical protein